MSIPSMIWLITSFELSRLSLSIDSNFLWMSSCIKVSKDVRSAHLNNKIWILLKRWRGFTNRFSLDQVSQLDLPWVEFGSLSFLCVMIWNTFCLLKILGSYPDPLSVWGVLHVLDNSKNLLSDFFNCKIFSIWSSLSVLVVISSSNLESSFDSIPDSSESISGVIITLA